VTLNQEATVPAAAPTSAAPALYWRIFWALVTLALVPTIWTALDLDLAAWFHEQGHGKNMIVWWWVEAINLHLPAAFRVVVVLALAAWLVATLGTAYRQWRLPLAFVVLSGALGPGLLVNSGFKEHWQRSRPYEVQNFGGTQEFTRAGLITDQCNNNCSFVSGHVSCGFFFISLMLVDARRRRLWAAVGLVGAGVVGFARMADMAHWLSDVLWAGPITLVCSWIVWRALCWSYASPAAKPSITSG
jgi:lipid A 4'-phosphatase